MSATFFDDLGLPAADIYLGIGSGTHAEQTAKVLTAMEAILINERPDLVVVVGDVNSTMAATLACAKLGVRTAHLEAGLRSYDRRMPEEINRLVTDVLADVLLTPSRDADANLIAEGVAPEKIHFVGNIMIDTLEMLRDRIEVENAAACLGLKAGSYGVVTIHRPSNVDDLTILTRICKELGKIAECVPLVFPVHPRTRRKMEEHSLVAALSGYGGLLLPEPQSYVRFMNLVMNSRFVITDSGGIQEETSYLGIPCLTLRENTERPITITHGTNQLCTLADLRSRVEALASRDRPSRSHIEYWDGRTAERIVTLLRPTT
jgi:UDP-N-acetylglucosamine 2-epimerase (non-hydrolysing)